MKVIARIAALLLGIASLPVSAQGNGLWEEYDMLIRSAGTVGAMGPDLFGDQVNYYTGGLSFSNTDISLRGNSVLSVALTRIYTASNRKGYSFNDLPMADWDLDLPRLTGPTHCSATTVTEGRPPHIFLSGVSFLPEEYWHGSHLVLPGGGGGEMLLVNAATPKPTAGGPYYWVSGQTFFSCLPSIKNMTGEEGFLAIAPDGTKYWFDWMASYSKPALKKSEGETSATLVRSHRVLYASRVEDRFGNWVTYTFTNASNAPARLASIDASDGRRVTLTYNSSGHVATASDGTRTWQYQYNYSDPNKGSLSIVILPDLKRWTIDFAPFLSAIIRYYHGEPGTPWRDCLNPGDVDETTHTGTIIHPSGAVGEFSIFPTRFGRSGVPRLCAGYRSPPYTNPQLEHSYYPVMWDAYALSKKRISGPGLTPAEWNFFFASQGSFHNGSITCSNGLCVTNAPCTAASNIGSSHTEITGPDNDYVRYTFGNRYRCNEGKLFKVEHGAGPNAILRSETMTYELAQSGQPFPTPIGTSPQPRGDGFTSEYLRPQRSTVITQQGTSFSNIVNQFDSLARPTNITKSSTVAGSPSKTEAVTYHDNLSKWVIGQIATVTNTSTTPNVVTSRSDYDAATALPIRIYGPGTTSAVGKLQQTLTYNTDGTLATVSDGRDSGSLNTTITLSNWKRGIPQLIRHPTTPDQPAGTTESAVVDNNGWIDSVTDENGYKTCYTYDTMGRLASITYPSETQAGVCDTSTWARTTLSFQDGYPGALGLPAGHWRQIVQTGNGRKTILFDALWRPVVEQTLDLANIDNTRSEVAKRYDAAGRLAFQSYPMRTVGNFADPALKGVKTEYDALDRVTAMEQDSELGVLTTEMTYLSGFRRQTKNPRGNVTIEAFQAWDTPSYDAPTVIDAPQGVRTTISRDKFGKPLEVLRSGPDG